MTHQRIATFPSVLRLTTLVAVLTAGLVASAIQFPANAEDKPMERTVTVSATGAVSAVPDEAQISSGVTTEGATARDAVTANSAAMTKVIAALKTLGIDARDIQTSSFNVEPITAYTKDNAPPRITGYRVNNQVSVLIRDLTRVGEAIDQIISSGANQINGLTFQASKAETLKDDARKAAMANAIRRATLLATAGGAEVGKVLQIAEDVAMSPGPMFRRAAMAAESVPIESGSVNLEARVTVTFELK